MSTRLLNKSEVLKALAKIIERGAVFEVRALDAQLCGNRRTGTVSGYFDNIDACLSELEKLTAAKGIYITLNPVDRAFLARRANRLDYANRDGTTKDQHILQRWWLLLDGDYDRPSGISATDSEKEATHKQLLEIYAYLKSRGWPLPIAADSGNGYHLDYRIDLPCEDNRLIEKVLAALADRFDRDGVKIDRSVHNPARIVRLYGTLAAKGDNTEERPHRLSKILKAPDTLQVVSFEQLQALVDELLPKEPEKPKAGTSRSAVNSKPSKGEVREMLAVLPKRPHYHNWIEIVAAVGDALPDPEAIEVLDEWSPEEEPGEYAKKLQSGFSEIHVGTLIRLARQYGWTGRIGKAEFVRARAGKSEPVELPPQPPPYVSPPLNLLPSQLQDYVLATAESLNSVDLSFILLPLLSAIAAAIGNSRSILLKRGYIEPPIIWSAVIAETGRRKTPAIEKGTIGVERRERQLQRENKQAKEIYSEDLAAWESASKTSRGKRPREPISLTCKVDDLTIETLADRLVENPRGILVAREELSGWIASFDQYRSGVKGADVTRWLSLHTGISFSFDRRSDRRMYRINLPRVSLTGTLQPETLQRVLTQDFFDRGLPARILFAHPPFKERETKWTNAEVDQKIEIAVFELFDELWSLQPDKDDYNELCPRLLRLDPEAQVRFIEHFNQCGHTIWQSQGREAAAWSKMIGYAARFALIGQLTRQPQSEITTGDTMAAACELALWFGNEATRDYAALAETPQQREQRDLIEFIKRRGGVVTVRETITN